MRFITAIALFALPLSALAAEKPVIYDGCELTGHLPDVSQTRFTINVQAAIYSVAQSQDVKNWLGTSAGTTPSRATTLLILRIGGVAVTIPYKAYADLGNPNLPNGVTLTQDSAGLYLYVRGGDGAAAYVAKFVVVNGKLARREVVPADSPDSSPLVMIFDK